MESFVKLVPTVLSGDPVTNLILVLLLVIAGLTVAVIKLWKQNNTKDSHIRAVTVEYINRLDGMMNQYLRQQDITSDALKNVQLVLAEMKGKLK